MRAGQVDNVFSDHLLSNIAGCKSLPTHYLTIWNYHDNICYMKINTEDQDQDYDRAEPEEIDGECPECKSHRMIRYMQANGPDDYDWIYECLDCGTTQST